MENEAIDANIWVMRNTQLLNEPGLVAQSTQCRHEPTIAIAALPDIVSGRAIDIELGPLKNVNHPFGALRFEVAASGFDIFDFEIVEGLQAVPDAELEISFNVKVRISVLLVDATAFPDYLVDFSATHSRCVVVGGLGSRRGTLLGVAPRDPLGIGVLGNDRGGYWG